MIHSYIVMFLSECLCNGMVAQVVGHLSSTLRTSHRVVRRGLGVLSRFCRFGKISVMGKRKRKDKNLAGGAEDKKNPAQQHPKNRSTVYEEIVKENISFEQYYKTQKICTEEEWNSFMAALRESLPAAFRITGYRSQAKALLKIVQGQYFKEILTGETAEGGEGDVPKVKPICLPWYPENLAWQLNLTRKDIRKSEAFFRLHNFLVSETESGNISRQEAVSMIPPLVLDIKSHHKVLDMCAAPGSKTAQLIEMLHADEGKLPEGFVIANDADNKRCYMLVHQAKRLQSPAILISNHDASVMPNITVTQPDGSKGLLKFDRILCDVPCSGDGTLRKNPDVWKKWNTANGNNLHGIQYRIAKRGAELLSLGGRMVYSTCSLNPLEDEAVIHRLMVETEGALALVDIAPLLPGLRSRQGLTHWVPMSRDMVGYDSFEEVPEKWHTQIRPAMFPPRLEEAEKFRLHRCIRVLPHHQDTGGFFVAVLEKTQLLPWEKSSGLGDPQQQQQPAEAPAAELLEGEAVAAEVSKEAKEGAKDRSPPRKKRKMMGYKEDPFVFLEPNEPIWPSIRDFYQLDSKLEPSWFLTRCKEGKKKNIYFTTPAVRDIVINNEEKLKIINTGVKTFVRCDNKGTTCDFRLAQEGVKIIHPFVGARLVRVPCDDLVTLLTNDDDRKPPEIFKLGRLTQEQLSLLETGSLVLVYEEPAENGNDSPLKIELVGWKGKTSVRAYVPKNERVHYLRLCGADISKFEHNKFKEREKQVDGVKEDPDASGPTQVDGDEMANADAMDTDMKISDEVKETEQTEEDMKSHNSVTTESTSPKVKKETVNDCSSEDKVAG